MNAPGKIIQASAIHGLLEQHGMEMAPTDAINQLMEQGIRGVSAQPVRNEKAKLRKEISKSKPEASSFSAKNEGKSTGE